MKNECAWCHRKFDVHDPMPHIIDGKPFHRTIIRDGWAAGCAYEYQMQQAEERKRRQRPDSFPPGQDRTDF